jgi:hypothetical protein
LTAWYSLIKGNEQRHKPGFKMQKCPLCDKKIPQDARFCPQCGWDLTDHELTPLQIARIQEETVDARFRATEYHVSSVVSATIAIACILVAMFASFEVIPGTWHFMMYIGFAFVSIDLALGFRRERYRKKGDRLKMMLRDRQSSQ